jgi:hypothetical protein
LTQEVKVEREMPKKKMVTLDQCLMSMASAFPKLEAGLLAMATDAGVALLSVKRRKEPVILLYLYSAPLGAEYPRRES